MGDVALGLLTPLAVSRLHLYLLQYVLATEYGLLPLARSSGSCKKERENAKRKSKRRKKQIGMYNRSYQNYVLPVSGIKTAGVKVSTTIIIIIIIIVS